MNAQWTHYMCVYANVMLNVHGASSWDVLDGAPCLKNEMKQIKKLNATLPRNA